MPEVAMGPPITAFLLAAEGDAMMEEGPSAVLFVALVVALSVAAAAAIHPLLTRMPLRRAVPLLALIGPLLAVAGSLIGTGAMTLSGQEIWYALGVSVVTGAASIVVGLRLARPVANDLDRVMGTVEAVAAGDRSARTGIDRRDDEIGKLASAVDELSRSLARAEEERAAADIERQAVVSALSHDLRTPLASLLVSVVAVQDGVGDTSAHLRAMHRNVVALESLIDDLFLLARADSGALALGSEPLDLAELIDEAVEAIGPVAAHKGVVVRAEIEGPLPVHGDHRALGRVLRNLLDNAVRHSPERGAVRIVDVGDHDTVRIEVLDEGEGFPMAFLPQAFDRFTQADGARSSHGGAGLGLAIAHTLLAAHEGIVAAEAGPGGRIRIELPVPAESEAEPPRVTLRSPQPELHGQ
ncbi:MAG: ATP-binding protein [Actinomycetota bacterium]